MWRMNRTVRPLAALCRYGYAPSASVLVQHCGIHRLLVPSSSLRYSGSRLPAISAVSRRTFFWSKDEEEEKQAKEKNEQGEVEKEEGKDETKRFLQI